MPLLDHFHPPLSELRPWESFHTTWATAIADYLNLNLLPAGYIALEQVHSGPAIEIDVATYQDSAEAARLEEGGGTATVTRTVWTPTAAPMVLPASFPPTCTVEIHATEGGRTLVAAVELLSPGNKDRASKRRLFAAKCATYLSRGIGLVIIDVVTSRPGNMHDEITQLMGLSTEFQMPGASSLYCVAYRPLRVADADRIEAWPTALVLGEPLPTVPLSLGAELCVPLELEEAYTEACQRRKVDEAMVRGVP
jgi:hypothetical protein